MSNLEFIKQKLGELHSIVKELEDHFDGRKFTLDGHLFGSLGEVIAKECYNIDLAETGKKIHDGEKDGKNVQIKITQGNSVTINGIPDNLLVLFWDKQGSEILEVYYGPCDWLKDCKTTKTGGDTRRITLNALYEHRKNMNVSDDTPPEIKRWYPTSKNK